MILQFVNVVSLLESNIFSGSTVQPEIDDSCVSGCDVDNDEEVVIEEFPYEEENGEQSEEDFEEEDMK